VGKAAHRRANEVNEVMISLLQDHPHLSITPDRGKEFSAYELVTAALDNVPFYFPLPRHPWQRGTSENTNGLLREYFPKYKSLEDVSIDYIKDCTWKLNMRPRKCLGYRTPYEVYFSKVLHLV